MDRIRKVFLPELASSVISYDNVIVHWNSLCDEMQSGWLVKSDGHTPTFFPLIVISGGESMLGPEVSNMSGLTKVISSDAEENVDGISNSAERDKPSAPSLSPT